MRSSFSQYKVCNKSCGIAYNFTILIKIIVSMVILSITQCDSIIQKTLIILSSLHMEF